MTWKNVKTDGYPDCDGETVYVGVDPNGFCGCFNYYSLKCAVYVYGKSGTDLTSGKEIYIMTNLKWWQELELPK